MNAPVVAIFPGDDAAPEAMEAAVAVLAAVAPALTLVYPSIEDPSTALEGVTTALFGAASQRSAAMLFHLRWGRGTYANVRPTRWFDGLASPLVQPEGIDLVIVRENLEDAYVRVEGDLAELAPLHLRSITAGVALHALPTGTFAVKAVTRSGCERVVRHAFLLARRRRRRLVATAKANMLPRTDGLFLAVARELASDFPDVTFETLLVDDFAHRLARDSQQFDVVVTMNLYGDILSDVAAGLVGGLGTSPSGCYGDDFAYFEPVHGTAPDLVGRSIINPVATIRSAEMMLVHLEMKTEAMRLRLAVESVHAEGRWLTPDAGGRASTREVACAIIDAL